MIGQKVNNYEIRALIGEGGMGAVYLAEHPVIQRRVAIKFLRRELSENKELVSRFFNEAKAASSIRNRSMVEVLDLGTLSDGIPYMVMEYLPGESLAQRLSRTGKMPYAEALPLLAQVADALKAAHAKDIIHRDLKPENLFLTVQDESDAVVVKVLDFGIAKLHGDWGSDSVKTKTGAIMGTPFYMAPEQCRGLSDEIDVRTDVYALGTILFEMVCGRAPFVSAGLGDVLIKHVMELPPDPRLLCTGLPEAVAAVIGRALQKNKADRFPSMAAFAQALRDPALALNGPAITWAALSETTGDLPPADRKGVTTGATRLLADARSSSQPGQTRVLGDAAAEAQAAGTRTTLGAAAGERATASGSGHRSRRAKAVVVAAVVGVGAVTMLLVTLQRPATRPPSQPETPQPGRLAPAAATVESNVSQPVPPAAATPAVADVERPEKPADMAPPQPAPIAQQPPRRSRPARAPKASARPSDAVSPSAATPPPAPKKAMQPEMW